MISFQDILAKTAQQRHNIYECLQKTNKKTGWHPEDASLYDGLTLADEHEIRETLRTMSLAEVLQKGSTAMGADSLVAAKLHDTLILAAKPYDLCELVGYIATRWEGGDLKVQVAVDGSYTPKPFSSTGTIPDVNAKFVQCTAKPIGYGVPIVYGGDLREDQDYDIAQWHVEQAAKQCGLLASDLALAELLSPQDGDGTANTLTTTTTDTTDYDEILNAADENGRDQFVSNTLITTLESWEHAVNWYEVAGGTAGDYGKYGTVNTGPVAAGFDLKLDMLDVKFWNTPRMHDAADVAGAAFTTCKSVVFDRKNAVLTARKRWLEIKDFANPFEDIGGAVVSFRQDAVTLYKDAICVVTEST